MGIFWMRIYDRFKFFIYMTLMEQADKSSENIVIDDRLLARKCADGDNDAMGVLITKYQDKVYNVILKICQNPNDALELTQETFVKVIENIGKFRGNSRLFTWIYRIAVNLTLNFCSRNVKFGADSLDSGAGNEGNESGNALKNYLSDQNVKSPEEIAIDKELAGIAEQALASISEEHRVIVILRDVENLGYSEIAEILEIEPGTVKSRISRGRDALRKVFKAMVE